MTKTFARGQRRGVLNLKMEREADGELLAAVVAAGAARRSGDVARPIWCRTRTSTLRIIGQMMTERGWVHFSSGAWREGLTPQTQAVALEIGYGVVEEFFPELAVDRQPAA